MPSSLHVCILENIAAVEASMAERRSLMAKLDSISAAIKRSWARPAPEIPKRVAAAKVEDEDVANARMAARVIEALSAAGITFELRHLGDTLQ